MLQHVNIHGPASISIIHFKRICNQKIINPPNIFKEL